MKQPLRPLREVVPTCLILRSACTSGELDLHVEQHPWAFWSNEQGTNIWIQKYVLHDHTFVDIWMSALAPLLCVTPGAFGDGAKMLCRHIRQHMSSCAHKDADVFKCRHICRHIEMPTCSTGGDKFVELYVNTFYLVVTNMPIVFRYLSICRHSKMPTYICWHIGMPTHSTNGDEYIYIYIYIYI